MESALGVVTGDVGAGKTVAVRARNDPATIMTPAVAARIRQLAAQAEHRRAIAEFRAQHLADQQTRINALLLGAIAALASLPGAPDQPGSPAA